VNQGKASIQFVSFAFIGAESKNAAAAAECAADQNRFWEYHDLLFARQGQENSGVFSKANLKRFAEELKRAIPDFDTKTFDIEAGDVRTIGTRHALSYGGNYRHNAFDISLAPNGKDRNEGGGYVQDEIFLNDQFRWIVGGRLDKFSSIDNAVFSPRTTFMYKPHKDHTFRVSYNRAFRAPSLVNNHLDVTVVTPVVLPVPGVLKNAKKEGWDDKFNKTLQEIAWDTVNNYPYSGVKAEK